MQSTVTKAPVGLWLARGSQRLGMSTGVAAAMTRTGIEQGGGAKHCNQSPSGALVSPGVPTSRNVYRGCCNLQPVRGIEGTRRPAGRKKEPGGLFFSVRVPTARNVYRDCCTRKGFFNLTRTGIAAELTAASEQRLPPVGGRCRIVTKRGVQGSEAGAVASPRVPTVRNVKKRWKPF